MKPNEPEGSGVLERRIQEVTQANRMFYEAFESLDIAKMDEVWAHLDYVTCVHPGLGAPLGVARRTRLLGLDLQQHLFDEV